MKMRLRIERQHKKSNYTIGKLYINDVYFCDTLEPTDRGLTSTMSEATILQKKIKGQTAIPAGVYEVILSEFSPKFGVKQFYKDNANGGLLPRLVGVKGFEGVLFHVGNYARDTDGCILVGANKAVGAVLESSATFVKLYETLKRAKCTITLEIK